MSVKALAREFVTEYLAQGVRFVHVAEFAYGVGVTSDGKISKLNRIIARELDTLAQQYADEGGA